MHKKFIAVIISVMMALTCMPAVAFASDDSCTKDTAELSTQEIGPKVTANLDSVNAAQEISMDSDTTNFVVGVYNGKVQNFNFEAEEGWSLQPKDPKITDANISLTALVESLEKKSGLLDDIIKKYGFSLKATKGSDEYSTTIVPVILPREFFVEFNARQLNFVTGHRIDKSEILRAQSWAGYESLLPMLAENISSISGESVQIEEGQMHAHGNRKAEMAVQLLNAIIKISATSKTGVCDADKKTADRIIRDYVSLNGMPISGLKNKISLAGNVQFDFAKMMEDSETDEALAAFLNNYDLLMQIIMLDDGSFIYNKVFDEKHIISNWTYSYDNAISINMRTFVARIANQNAEVNFSNELNTISANDMVKKYHVKKAKKLKKTKTFMYKATAAYGNVSYKKISGDKKISINKYTGKVTVKKGLKKNKTYTVKVQIAAPGVSVTKKISVKIVK